MEDDDADDTVPSAIAIGKENLRIIHLAKAWCQRIDVTKGPMGTGLLEEMTGLPISGGSLRCDHAQPPQMFGMRLEPHAADFYERNCIGCAYRLPTSATEHLGTWAGKRLAARDAAAQQAADEQRQADDARARRREQRRLLLGAPDATVQSILDLVDRVDSADGDPEAEKLLRTHAELSPGDFPDPLIDHLTSEAIAIGRGALLESVVAVFERQGRPRKDLMLQIVSDALARGVAASAAGRVIAAHADRDVSDGALLGAVELAAGREDPFRLSRRADADPAALLRLYDIVRGGVVDVIATTLRDDDPRRRATAGHAAEKLEAARPPSGMTMLPALLECVVSSDKSRYVGDPFAAEQARSVVGSVLARHLSAAASVIDARLEGCDAPTAQKLWGCFDCAVRSRDDADLSQDLVDLVSARGLAHLRGDPDVELAARVSNTLGILGRKRAEAIDLQPNSAIDLVLHWVNRFDRFEAEANAPRRVIGWDEASLAQRNLDILQTRNRLSAVLGEIERFVRKSQRSRADDYIRAVLQRWESIASDRARESLLETLGGVVARQQDADAAEPLLVLALKSGQTRVRAGALRAIAEFDGPDLRSSPRLSDLVLAALSDKYLIVVCAAVRACRRIEVPAADRPVVAAYLLSFVKMYGPRRTYSSDVRSAAQLALRLCAGEPFAGAIQEGLLDIVGSLPSAEGAELLDGLGLEEHPKWPSTAVAVLREDREYGEIGDTDRFNVLRDLARQPTARVLSVADELVDVAVARIPRARFWAWAVADVLAHHQDHVRAAVICRHVLERIPDTREQRGRRRHAAQIVAGHAMDAALVAGDQEATAAALAEWIRLAEGAEE